MAQSFGVNDIFEKDAKRLIQEIEIKQQKLIPPKVQLPSMPVYDARLMSKPPARRSNAMEITNLLEPYITMGLKLNLTEERWYMQYGSKTDEGTMRMPPRIVLKCAERLMK